MSRQFVVFEPNWGQAAPQVRFLARTAAYNVFLTDTEAVLVVSGRRPSFAGCLKAECRSAPADHQGMSIRMKLVGAHMPQTVGGRHTTGGASNYFIGNDPKRWRTDIPHYTKVEYRGIYPGVDLVYYGNRGSLEYDFIVNPGASSGLIRLAFEGADSVRMEGSHEVVAETRLGKLRLSRPRIFQFVEGQRVELAGSYVMKNAQVSFAIAEFDRTRPLIIDPTLSYSSYLGGSDSDNALALALDSSGNFYVAGETRSIDFPTTPGPFQADPDPFNGFDAFITKFSPAGQVVYSSYFGGGLAVGYQSTADGAAGIAVDTSGNAYVVGSTWSINFPTTPGAFQPQKNYNIDAFVLKLNPAGNALLYSTYLGGFENDAGLAIAIDGAGSAYVTGWTAANWNFPVTPGAFQTHQNVYRAAFVTKFSPDGSSLVYSTFLTGHLDQRGLGIAVDGSGSAYVTGWTNSNDFPTTPGAYKVVRQGSDEDVFVTKLNADGTAPVYSTLLGADEEGWGVAIAPDGAAVVTGWTLSCSFPVTPGAFRTTSPCVELDKEVFLTKIDPAGSALVYSTYFGGRGSEEPRALVLDNAGRPCLTGWTNSSDFPTTPDRLQGVLSGPTDAFVMQLSGDGKSLVFSSYLGGNGSDEGWDLAVDAGGNFYLVGFTESSDFPITSGASQGSIGGPRDGFVAKIVSGAASTFTTVSAASFLTNLPVARDSIVSGFGQGLSGSAAGATSIPLPTTLAGVTVTMRDSTGAERLAPLFYVSPSQLNYLIPEGTAAGMAVTTVANQGRVVAAGSLQVERIAPALFAANANGQGVAAAD
ncbi:MAG: SBBP repeat-containing protein, partial [Acidobacteria bacterium]|nr:SBBP repeat-containing protein [Acidobacteriota bacterium]